MSSSNSSSGPAIGRTPTTWTDMSQHWHWPKLLKAIPMALGPSRLILALLFWLAFIGLDKLYVAIWGEVTGVGEGPIKYIYTFIGANIRAILEGVSLRGLDNSVSVNLHNLFIEGPWTRLSASATWWLIFVVPVFLTAFSVLAGALARSAACEFAADVRIGMGKSLGFAMKNFLSLFFAYAAPILVIWFICGAMAGVGWLMFHASVPAMIFSIFYFVFLLFALLVAVVAIAYFVGAIMLAPAIACEGTDAYDAVQRAYAYVFSKPFKLLWYAFIIVIAGVIATSLVWMVIDLVISIAGTVSGAEAHTVNAEGSARPSFPRRSANWTIGFWKDIVKATGTAFVICYAMCAGTILYLLMRKAADGQEMEEIWMPGMVPGTAATAAAAAPAAKPA